MEEKPDIAGTNPESVANNQSPQSIFCSEATHRKMGELLDSFDIPNWVVYDAEGKPRQCCDCNHDVSRESVRSISICLNAQHFGDIQIEFLCLACFASYFLHFRKACDKMGNFVIALSGVPPKGTQVLMHKIKSNENNLADALIDDASKKQHL